MLRTQQEIRMQEIVNEQKIKDKEKQILEEEKHLKKLEKLQKKESIESMREIYSEYKPTDEEPSIEIHIRLPNGKRIVQNFEKSKNILFVKNYILQLENNGITDQLDESDESDEEDEEVEEIELMTGFPPRELQENLTLLQCFGKSTGEAITVKCSL